MKNRLPRLRSALFISLMLFVVAAAFVCHFAVPNVISVYVGGDAESSLVSPFTLDKPSADPESAEAMAYGESVASYKAEAYVLGVFPLKTVSVNVYDRLMLCPGGMTVGVRMETNGVVVTGISELSAHNGDYSPAYNAGVRVHDVITAVNGKAVSDAADVIEAIESCAGGALDLTVQRGDSELSLNVCPVKPRGEDAYKAGFTLKDGATGLGTVTFIDPSTGAFAALGHGITDSSLLLPFSSGSVSGVIINDIHRGKAAEPGEISGSFSSERFGSLTANTHAGIFGVFTDNAFDYSSPLPIALKDEIEAGPAFILSTDGKGGVERYDVEISAIDRSGTSDVKNFIVEVVDPALISLTGGIVQGMSGSPIIQNGRIIGALTHVMINDPHRGYGIFVENMIKEMNLVTQSSVNS